jgi:hypothetical protein
MAGALTSAGAASAAGTGGQPTAGSGAAGTTAPPTAACATGAACYGFEEGILGQTGALWPSPDNNGGLPLNGELSTLVYPTGSTNHVLVCTPSSLDDWPKAVVGYSDGSPFSQLTVDFDVAATEGLANPADPVVFYRFTMVPGDHGSAVDLIVRSQDIGVLIHRADDDANDVFEQVGTAAAVEHMTHVKVIFSRSATACSVTVNYGVMPAKTVAMFCDLSAWQMEFGLNVLLQQGATYTSQYSAYYDNLSALVTP